MLASPASVVSRNPACEEVPELTARLGEYVCIIPMTTFPIHNMVCDTITVSVYHGPNTLNQH